MIKINSKIGFLPISAHSTKAARSTVKSLLGALDQDILLALELTPSEAYFIKH